MVIWTLLLLLAVAFLPTLATASVFVSPKCIERLTRIEQKYHQAFQIAASSQNLLDGAGEEYVRRRIGAQYFEEEAAHAQEEAGIWRRAVKALVENEHFLQNVRWRTWVSERFMCTPGESEQAYTYLFGILGTKCPNTIHRAKQLDRILRTRTLLRTTRAAVSEAFVSLPYPQKIRELDPDTVREKAEEEIRSFHKQLAKKLVATPDAPTNWYLDRILFGNWRVATSDLDALENMVRTLTESREIPAVVQEEIRFEVLFKRTYRIPWDLFFAAHVEDLTEYFGLSSTP